MTKFISATDKTIDESLSAIPARGGFIVAIEEIHVDSADNDLT